MQSSTAIAIRALIMLIVLISVPLFAIFGKSLPDVVKGLMEGRGLVLGPAPGADANAPNATPTQTANNPFAQPGPYRAAPGSSVPTNQVVAAAPAVPNPAAMGNLPSVGNLPGALLSAGGANQQNALAPNRPSALSAINVPSSMPTGADAARLASAVSPVPGGAMPASIGVPSAPGMTAMAQPASFVTTSEGAAITPVEPSRDFNAAGPSNAAGSSAAPHAESPYGGNANFAATDTSAKSMVGPDDEKFRRAEARLRELGATHYMLETWGPDNNRYRFVCKMAIGGNAEVNRFFQAIDDNPWQAMESVLQQVEQWRTRPQPQ